jgi:hypothetical protein
MGEDSAAPLSALLRFLKNELLESRVYHGIEIESDGSFDLSPEEQSEPSIFVSFWIDRPCPLVQHATDFSTAVLNA